MKEFMIYMVGISGSGKTTIASALEQELKERGMRNLQFIDGDVIRSQVGNIFGYTFEERMKMTQVARVVAQYLIQNHISVILAQVGAYEAMRSKVREAFGDHYIEIYIKCSYDECARRDVKGYYKMQKKGQIENLNGADDAFEVPEHSNLVIDTEKVSVGEAVQIIINYLETNGYVLGY